MSSRTSSAVVAGMLAAGVLVILTGCGIAQPAPTVTRTVTATPHPTPSASGTAAPSGEVAPEVVGTCTDGGAAVPAIYSVWSSRGDGTLSLTVDAFDADGTVRKVSRQVTGASATVLSWACGDGANRNWTVTASSSGAPDATNLYCQILSYAGVVRSEHHFGDEGGAATVTCSGNPGGA